MVRKKGISILCILSIVLSIVFYGDIQIFADNSASLASSEEYDFTISNVNISKDTGIAAEATVTSNTGEGGNAVVIFKLMRNDGTVTGLSSSELFIEDSSVFRVKFHGYSGDEYKVKVFVWDKLNSSIGDIGVDLAEPVEILSATPTATPIATPTPVITGEYYYVNQTHPEASDSNPGTQAQPWLTIQNGMANVRAGDTLIVQAGIYEEAVTTIVEGTKSLPVTIKAYPGDKVVVDRFWVSRSHYKIEGFDILGSRYAAIYIKEGTSNVEISGNTINVINAENVSAINCPGGAYGQSTNGLIIKNNTFGPSVEADTFCIRLRGYNHLVTQNTFNYWNGRDSIIMQARESVISNNIFNSISHWEGTAMHPDCIQVDVEADSTQNDVIVENNIFRNCSGQGIRMYQNASNNQHCPNWVIRNNLFINMGAKALQARGDNCRVYNNLFYLSTVNTSHPLGFLSDNTNSISNNNLFIGCGSNPNSGNQGWWNEDPSVPIEHDGNFVAGHPSSGYMSKDRFIESTGINGGDPMLVNAHVDWVWADDNGDDYNGSNSSFEVNEGDINKFNVNEFIEYSSFINGADGVARKIISIEGNIVHFEPCITGYTPPDCGVEKPGYFADGDICNMLIMLWGEQDWQSGDTIVPDFSLVDK
ncbi:MAG: hypothetical protein GX800_11705 [Clostridiaceae bacterium]|nr:hypothetical protein [Clostridiaceae bacterium]